MKFSLLILFVITIAYISGHLQNAPETNSSLMENFNGSFHEKESYIKICGRTYNGKCIYPVNLDSTTLEEIWKSKEYLCQENGDTLYIITYNTRIFNSKYHNLSLKQIKSLFPAPQYSTSKIIIDYPDVDSWITQSSPLDSLRFEDNPTEKGCYDLIHSRIQDTIVEYEGIRVSKPVQLLSDIIGIQLNYSKYQYIVFISPNSIDEFSNYQMLIKPIIPIDIPSLFYIKIGDGLIKEYGFSWPEWPFTGNLFNVPVFSDEF